MHEETTRLLNLQVSDLKRERELLLDRLATIGLGGPLFNLPSQQDSSASTETEEELIDPNAEIERLISMRRRPSKMAQAVTNHLRREFNKIHTGLSVARIPDMSKINAELDAAEQQGRKKA
jgi:hypothetical protein